MFQKLILGGFIFWLSIGVASAQQDAQKFKPGQVIEYRDGTAVPEKWERGVIIKALEGGKQYLIRRKPSEFFPEGAERAYAPADLRVPAANNDKKPDNGKAKQADGDKTKLPVPAVNQDGQTFKPGQVIEYRDGFSVPEKWERGVIVKALEGGKQYIIRRKPTKFDPEGAERAYAPADLRVPGANNDKKPDDGKTKQLDGDKKKQPDPAFNPGPLPKGVIDILPFRDGAKDAKGLLSEEDVLAYARKVFGGADKLTNQANLMSQTFAEQIRDYIKMHGTNFNAASGGKFDNAMNEQGTKAINIIHAINDNYGPAPTLKDYFGTFFMRNGVRGVITTTPGAGKKVNILDDQKESGRLTINPNGTYEWELLHGDPPAKWIRGKWREAKSNEMFPTEGGIAIWLDHTNGGQEYMVRMSRVEGYSGWIDVGVGPGRSPVQYGRPKAK